MVAISSLTSAAPLAALIFLVTIGLVIARPRGLTEATSALLGAGAMMLAGLVSPAVAATNVADNWNVLPRSASGCSSGFRGEPPMSEARRLLVTLAGSEDPALVVELAGVLGPGEPTLDIRLLHVVDSGPRGLLPIGPGLRRGPWPRPSQAAIQDRMTDAEGEGATALLATWHDRFAVALTGATITMEVRRGQPEHEIIAASTAFDAAVVVMGARPRTGPTEPGPRSVGHVARFVVDHAPVPVLLVRRSA